MQQFALASVHPRSIAWLIRSDEWERLEMIIKYNSAMLGGYYNVIIPLAENDILSEKYRRFLLDYDPDFIVLAPDMGLPEAEALFQQFHPFCFILWDEVNEIATLDPLGRTSQVGETMISMWVKVLTEPKQFSNMLLAVADPAEPDISRLALLACGDVEPRELDFNVVDGDIDIYAKGYLEAFLLNFLRPEYDEKTIMPYMDEDKILVPTRDRYTLKKVLKEENCFPLSGTRKTLATCCRLQTLTTHQSFIGLTASYKKTRGTPERINHVDYPSLVILVSDHFSVEEGVLFWNLRASEVYVAWLSFPDIEGNSEEVSHWLESDTGGILYTLYSGFRIVFSSPEKDITRLNKVINLIKSKAQKVAIDDLLEISAVSYDNLVFYDYIRPPLRQEYLSVVKDHNKISFLPKLPQEYTNGISLTLEWSGAMLPQSINRVTSWMNKHKRYYKYMHVKRVFKHKTSMWEMFCCRINNKRYPSFQLDTEKPIEFEIPSLYDIVSSIFLNAHFSRIELSSTSRYHTIFVERAGGLDQATYYLANSPYRLLLETLADNSTKNKTGWLVEHPSKRRVFNHFDLWKTVGEGIPTQTDEYYRQLSDKLPAEVAVLLEKRILERGFLITCDSCSFKSWYPVEFIGQDFTCARCFQSQVYRSNPLWLYKLPEILFQGFNNDMQVPLLVLDYMKRRSKYHFDWMPDSNVFWVKGQEKFSRNIDIICNCDGGLYVGEAKSADTIEKGQFLFYQQICQRVAIDGIIFATSQEHWDKKTLNYIETLKKHFSGEVLSLTRKDLYLEK